MAHISTHGLLLHHMAIIHAFPWPAVLLIAGVLATTHASVSRADIYDFYGAVIPGTEGVTAGPSTSFDGLELRHADLRFVDLTGSSFVGATIESASFVGSTLVDVEFSETHVAGVYFDHLNLAGSRWRRSSMVGSVWRRSPFDGVSYGGYETGVVAAVPEPAGATLILMVALLGVRARRSRAGTYR